MAFLDFQDERHLSGNGFQGILQGGDGLAAPGGIGLNLAVQA